MGWLANLLKRGNGSRSQKTRAQPVALEATTIAPDARKEAESARAAPPAPEPQQAAPAFPQFHATANDRLDRKLSGRVAQARLNLRNAYTPAQPITDRRMFAGRSEVLTALIRAIEDQRLHVIIYGERGIGKTSLLHVLSQSARDARYLTVYISCGATADFEEMFRAIASQIPLLYHSGYGPTSPQGEQGGTFGDLVPDGPISPRTASDLLSKVVGTRVLVLLDEFDRVEDTNFRRSIAELIKDLSDRSVRVQLVVAGVAANLTELIEHLPSIQRNIFALQAPKMTAREIRDLVTQGERLTGLSFSEKAITFIAAAANGFPFLASLLTHHAAIAAVQEERLEVTDDDVSAAIAETLTEFQGRISKPSQTQISRVVKERLHTLVGALSGTTLATGGRFTDDDILALNGANGEQNLARIKRLASEGLLIRANQDDAGDYYTFKEDTVPYYMWLLYIQSRFLASQAPAARGPAPGAAEG
jgi:Cdc6-like AAA superfamily ATPase